MSLRVSVAEISLNGWPVIQSSTNTLLRTGTVPGTDRRLTTRKEALPLFLAVAADWHRWIHPIDVGPVDTGGYANRDARAVPGRKSNHASGTAIDLNASKHPLGKAGTFEASKVPMLKALARKYGLACGLNWLRRDEMHFEISLDAVKVAALITKLGLEKSQ